MIKKFQLLFWLAFSVSVMAQSDYGSDRVSNYSQQKNNNAMAFKSIALKDTLLKDYGSVQLIQQYASGDLRRAQESFKSNNTALYTEGYHTLGKFWLAGTFSFNKMVEDSLANTLKGEDDGISPYYYFAAKNGRYERQNYVATALVDYELIANKLHIGSKIDYEYHWTTRSVDPRPSVKDFKLVLSPEISYAVSKKHTVAIGASWGYGYEETNVSFKNRVYTQSLAYPDRIHYINQGYGYISLKDSTSLRRFKDFSGLKMSYHYNSENWNVKLYGNYSKKTEYNTHDIKSRKNYYTREKFILDQYDMQFLMTKKSETNIQQVGINALLKDGNDWNVSFKKGNYTATDKDVSFHYSILMNVKKEFEHQANFNLLYQGYLRNDAVASHHLNAENLQPELKYTLYHQNQNKDFWKASVGTSYKMPLLTEMTVPTTQINAFTKTVMFPDYYYFKSTIIGVSNELNYVSCNLINNYKIGFSLQTIYLHKTNSDYVIYDAQFVPKGNKLQLNAGISIYL